MKKSILLMVPIALIAFAGCGRRNNSKEPTPPITTKTPSTKEQTTTKENPIPIANKEIYVAHNGKSSSDGSEESNPTTLDNALKLVNSGDTIYLASGTYTYDNTLLIEKSGSEVKRTKLIAKEGAVFDFDSTKGDAYANNGGITINGSYWELENITVKNSDYYGFYTIGKGNKFINCTADKNSNGGFGLKNASVTTLNNCVSTNNKLLAFSTRGFYILGNSENITFDSCVAQNNYDSGFCIDSSSAKKITFNKCLASDNGIEYSTSDRSGFVFKNNEHTFTDCIAYNNGLFGFYVTSTPAEKGKYSLIDCSAINNHEKNYSLRTYINTTINISNILSYNNYDKDNDGIVDATNDIIYGNVTNSLIFYTNGYHYCKSDKNYEPYDTSRPVIDLSKYTKKYKINTVIPDEMKKDGKIIYYDSENKINLYDYLDRSIEFQDEFFLKQTPSVTDPTYFGADINGIDN